MTIPTRPGMALPRAMRSPSLRNVSSRSSTGLLFKKIVRTVPSINESSNKRISWKKALTDMPDIPFSNTPFCKG